MKKLVLKKAVLDNTGNAVRSLESYKIRYADELNAEQLQAVMHDTGAVLVVAGAGTAPDHRRLCAGRRRAAGRRYSRGLKTSRSPGPSR